jgi:hypothetical protein
VSRLRLRVALEKCRLRGARPDPASAHAKCPDRDGYLTSLVFSSCLPGRHTRASQTRAGRTLSLGLCSSWAIPGQASGWR